MGNLQSIQAELEKSVEGEKRRLENQVKALEGQTCAIILLRSITELTLCYFRYDLREQLNKEAENGRHMLIQKGFEIKELNTRVESLVRSPRLFSSPGPCLPGCFLDP
jgi:nucleoprotein TPR